METVSIPIFDGNKRNYNNYPTIFGEYPASRIIRIKKVMVRVTGHNEDWVRPQLPLIFQS